jgi:DNA repair protein RadC
VVRGLLRVRAMQPTTSPLPTDERPRERFFSSGPDQVSDDELIALVLGTGTRGKSAVALAREVLDDSGGVSALGRALPQALAQHSGIGRARAARLAAAFALGRRALTRERNRDRPLFTARDVHELVWPRLAGVQQEVFMMIAIDARSAPVAEIEVSRGSLTGVEVHPREVFRPLIRVGAAAAIAVHNHPSGDPTPSDADVALTRRLVDAGALLGIPVLDHVIVASSGPVSVMDWVPVRKLDKG